MTLLRNRATRLMIVVFVGLLAFAAIANQITEQRRPPVITPAPAPYLFPDVLPTNITRMEITNQRFNRKITLERIPGDWIGTDIDGKTVEVDLTRIPPMLQILSSLRYTRKLESVETDPGKFGLLNGGWFVVKFEAAGKAHVLHIGDFDPSATASYVQLAPDGPVYLTDYNAVGRLVNLVDTTPEEIPTLEAMLTATAQRPTLVATSTP